MAKLHNYVFFMPKVPAPEGSTGVRIDGGTTNVRDVSLFRTVAGQEQLNAIGVIPIMVCNKGMGDLWKVSQCGLPCFLETISSLGSIDQNDLFTVRCDNQTHVTFPALKHIDPRVNGTLLITRL